MVEVGSNSEGDEQKQPKNHSFQITRWREPLVPVCEAVPRPEGREVLVRVECCGVCHSDLHIWHGVAELPMPVVMGHEIVGVVEAAGPEAGKVEIGARRILFPWIGCGACKACLAEREVDCEQMRNLGIMVPGGYGRYVLVPDSRYLIDPGSLAPEIAATLACSGLTAYSAIKKLPALSSDDTLLIIGAGGVGLAALGLARVLTTARIAVADIGAPQRKRAIEMGADIALDPREPVPAGLRFRAVLDFVGSGSGVEWALPRLEKGGRLIAVGLFGGEYALQLDTLPMRNMSLVGSYTGTLAEMQELVSLAQQGAVTFVPTQRRPIGEINTILSDLESGRIVGRVVVFH